MQSRYDKVYEKLFMELRVQNLPDLEASWYKRLRRIIANTGSFADDKRRSVLAKTGDSAYMGESSIIVTAKSILDVDKRPGSVSDISCINY